MTIPEQAVHAAHAEYHKVLGDSNRSNPMLAALTAALPFLTGVKVKALEWVKPPLSETLSRCETEFGTYRTWTHDEANGKWFWSVEGGYNELTGEANDEEAAKAEAQSDYEARIRPAIEVFGNSEQLTPPPSPRVQALDIVGVLKEIEEASAWRKLPGEENHLATAKILDTAAAAIRALSSQPLADGCAVHSMSGYVSERDAGTIIDGGKWAILVHCNQSDTYSVPVTVTLPTSPGASE